MPKDVPERKEPENRVPDSRTEEYAKLKEFTQTLNSLLLADKFLARSDYLKFVEEYAYLRDFFQNQKTAKTLSYYCSDNGVPEEEVEAFLRNYTDLSDFASSAGFIRQHNQAYIQRHLGSEKEYLDSILQSVDPAISLDEEQRRVVLSDEDYTLVIAGAGAGKTTTVVAKVRYLVERQPQYGGEVMFTLSPKVAFSVYDRECFKKDDDLDGCFIPADDKEVRRHNMIQYFYAQRQVFSLKNDFSMIDFIYEHNGHQHIYKASNHRMSIVSGLGKY